MVCLRKRKRTERWLSNDNECVLVVQHLCGSIGSQSFHPVRNHYHFTVALLMTAWSQFSCSRRTHFLSWLKLAACLLSVLLFWNVFFIVSVLSGQATWSLWPFLYSSVCCDLYPKPTQVCRERRVYVTHVCKFTPQRVWVCSVYVDARWDMLPFKH